MCPAQSQRGYNQVIFYTTHKLKLHNIWGFSAVTLLQYLLQYKCHVGDYNTLAMWK